jgi:hypothetical protein
MSLERSRRRSKGTWEGESSCQLCDRPLAGSATLVRGSSRRIMIVTADPRVRSANIRLINRRRSYFDQRLVRSRSPDGWPEESPSQ